MDNILAVLPAILKTTPIRWNDLAQRVPADLMRRAPAPGEWSALECLQHQIDTERSVFPVRVRAMLAGQDFPAFLPDDEGTPLADSLSPQDLAAEFEALRADSLDLLPSITPADLTRQARHAELGTVSMSELLHEWAGHDLMHLVQAEQALMQPFIEGCGPWLPYFEAHVIQAQ
jgi:hypothetical protein